MVYFIGAGPGDAELITVKGRDTLTKADVVIYAGSLVSKEHMNYCKAGCEIHNSASMTLEQVIEVMNRAEKENKMVVRLHTGDPAIYGAIKEQMDELDKLNIQYKVIPGVSSFTAAASVIKKEFTLPSVTQTVILTSMIDKVVAKLRKGYGRNVNIAVVERATWEDERAIIGTLDDIAEKVKEAGITKCAQILVGDFINCDYDKSLLYDKSFTHMFREGQK